MASTTLHLVHVTPLLQVRNAHPNAHVSKTAPPLPTRRQCLLTLTAAAALKAAPAKAEDIGLFGIRKRIKKAEEEVEEVVKEGIEEAEKGFEAAEKGLENAEKRFEAAERVAADGVGPAVQAAAVAGAEVVGVLVASSVVNRILGPEAQNL